MGEIRLGLDKEGPDSDLVVWEDRSPRRSQGNSKDLNRRK